MWERGQDKQGEKKWDEEIKEIKDGEGREEEGRNFCDNEMIMKCHFLIRNLRAHIS